MNKTFQSLPEDLNAVVVVKTLKLVINNLILNAITYSPPEKQVVLDAKMLKKKVKITVKDEAPGTSEELPLPHF